MEREIDERSVITAAEDQVSCDLEGEAVVLKFGTGVYHGLNEVGARAWGLVQRPATFREVLDAVVAEYDVEPEQCAQDLHALFAEMAAAGLIHVEHTETA
jgi:hypothetical protein